VTIGLKRHFAGAVPRADARALDLQDAPAEDDLAGLVSVPISAARRIGLALGADDVGDLLLHQLGEHAEADADGECEQPLLRRSDELPERRLHRLRQLVSSGADGGDDLDRL
jgi:hypothetical protein